MYKCCLMMGLLGLTFTQTIIYSCHAASLEIVAPTRADVSPSDAIGELSRQWKYYKVSRPNRDPRIDDIGNASISPIALCGAKRNESDGGKAADSAN